jgi:hypothetical protein
VVTLRKGILNWLVKKICANLRFNQRQSAGNLSRTMNKLILLKRFPQMNADK